MNISDGHIYDRLLNKRIIPRDYSFDSFADEFHNNIDVLHFLEFEGVSGIDQTQNLLRKVENHFKQKFKQMGYNNGYNSRGYSNRGYNNNYNNRPRKKRSKAGCGVGKNGKFYVWGWNASKQKGLIKVNAYENRKSKKYEVKSSGKKFIMMMFEIRYMRTGNTVLELASFCTTTGKVYLDKLGMVISCNAPNGGYMGKKGKN